ncbi:MAG: dephospho-CoA kinase [Clostridiales bacterium]|nr:dephospho-CoA kinase [Clostridiales bacterium]
MKIIGITGTIYCGKTTASKIIKKNYHAHILNADDVYHDLIKPRKDLYYNVVNAFGKIILNKDNFEIDRKKLSKIAFNNIDKLKTLNKITHNNIILEIEKKIIDIKKKDYDFIIVDAPLLFETEFYLKCDKNILIYCSKRKKYERLETYKKNILKREKFQMDFKSSKKLADFIIFNNKTKIDLENNIKKIFTDILI